MLCFHLLCLVLSDSRIKSDVESKPLPGWHQLIRCLSRPLTEVIFKFINASRWFVFLYPYSFGDPFPNSEMYIITIVGKIQSELSRVIKSWLDGFYYDIMQREPDNRQLLSRQC